MQLFLIVANQKGTKGRQTNENVPNNIICTMFKIQFKKFLSFLINYHSLNRIFLVFSYYYDRDIFIKNKTTYSALLNENILPINGNSPGDLDKFRDSKKLIGVYCHELLEDPNNTIKKELNLNFRIVESFDFEKVKVVLYENLQK